MIRFQQIRNATVKLSYFAATVIYPEQFADVDFDAKADEILTMFLGENGPSFMDMMDEAGLSYQHFAIAATIARL